MKAVRLTARGRLAILYTALVLAAGIVLTVLTYILMRRNLAHRSVFVQINPPGNLEPLPPEPQKLADLAEQVQAATLSELMTQAAVALAVVTLLAAVLGWLVAGRVLRPIRTISATAQRLSAENISERVPVTTPADELAALASTINGMLDRIQRGITERDQVLDSQRMFTANAAHELRTPLTTMRTAIDVTLDGQPTTAELLTMAGDIRTAVEHSQRTLDGLLALARSQTGPGSRRPVDLADVVAGILDSAADETTAQDITLRTDLQPAPISGEPILLERMVSNLVDNAVRYNHADGHITVTTGTAAAQAFLRITNTGPPIPPDEADGLLEPFVRGEGTRTHTDGGAGLGLSIVRAIVVAHRGKISTATRPTGGLDITVYLPAPADPKPHEPLETLRFTERQRKL
jgi:signal transduction histidine kinase